MPRVISQAGKAFQSGLALSKSHASAGIGNVLSSQTADGVSRQFPRKLELYLLDLGPGYELQCALLTPSCCLTGEEGTACVGAQCSRTSRRPLCLACSPSPTVRALPPWRQLCRCDASCGISSAHVCHSSLHASCLSCPSSWADIGPCNNTKVMVPGLLRDTCSMQKF